MSDKAEISSLNLPLYEDALFIVRRNGDITNRYSACLRIVARRETTTKIAGLLACAATALSALSWLLPRRQYCVLAARN